MLACGLCTRAFCLQTARRCSRTGRTRVSLDPFVDLSGCACAGDRGIDLTRTFRREWPRDPQGDFGDDAEDLLATTIDALDRDGRGICAIGADQDSADDARRQQE